MPRRKHRLYAYDRHPRMALVWAYDAQDAVARFSRVYPDVERDDVYPVCYNPFKVAILK